MPGRKNVMVAAPGVKLTYDDLLRLPDDGKRHELIDGEHYVTPSPNLDHQRILGNLYYLVRAWLEDHPVGRVFFAPVDVVLSPHDVVVPDLLYLSNDRVAQVATPANLRGIAELIVEIASPSTRKRDETIKRQLFDRCGATEYWIVDPRHEVVKVHRRDGAAFAPPVEYSRERGDTLTTNLLPGLELPLSRIFAA